MNIISLFIQALHNLQLRFENLRKNAPPPPTIMCSLLISLHHHYQSLCHLSHSLSTEKGTSHLEQGLDCGVDDPEHPTQNTLSSLLSSLTFASTTLPRNCHTNITQTILYSDIICLYEVENDMVSI